MTALAINQTVVDDTGRTDLCVDYAAGNYAPNTRGLELLNEAQQFLDRMYRNRGEEDQYTVDISAGSFGVRVPNVRHVSRMDMTAADGTRHELRRRSNAFMREQYGESFSLLDNGKPVDWARVGDGRDIGTMIDANFLTEPIIMDDTDTDGGVPSWKAALLANPNKWVAIQSNQWSWASGTLSWDKEALDETSCAVGSYIGRYIDATIVVDLDITVTTGTISFALVDYDGTDYTIVSNAQTVSASGDFELAATAPWNIIAIGLNAPADAGEGSVSRVSIAEKAKSNYIFLPPADQPYALSVFGGYYTRKFEIATDMSWWSDTYPGLLVMAYKMMIERHMHANDTRVNFWSGQIAFETKKLQIDLNEEDTAGPPKYMRRMPSAMWKRHQ